MSINLLQVCSLLSKVIDKVGGFKLNIVVSNIPLKPACIQVQLLEKSENLQ